MDSGRSLIDWRAIGASILFLFIGLFFASGLRHYEINKDAAYVTVFLLPVLVYLALTGKIAEIRAPGGLQAKFRKVAAEEIKPKAIKIDIPRHQAVVKGDPAELEAQLEGLDSDNFTILMMPFLEPQQGRYDQFAVQQYIQVLETRYNFRGIVVLDGVGRFVCYFPAQRVRGILESDQAEELIRHINEHHKVKLRSFPGAWTDVINAEAKNIDALKKMVTNNVRTLVVIDKERKLLGILEWENIVGELLIALAA